MEINTPPFFTDFSNYDLNCDGTKIAFSALIRNEHEAVKTGFKTYYYDLNLIDKPICGGGENYHPEHLKIPSTL